MRLSCNGCRVLRKGCSTNCTIRPCLQWIQSPESQANATLFLAKFYGRAGLINLIHAGLPHLRPVIFKSLLYESCGRIVNPTFGATGLLSSGKWHLCEAAVEAVLKGAPIVPASSESGLSGDNGQVLKGCDIRHVVKKLESSGVTDRLHKIAKPRNRFKRSGLKPKPEVNHTAKSEMTSTNNSDGSLSHESRLSRKNPTRNSDGGGEADTDGDSVETVEASMVVREEPADCSDVELELTLGFAQWGPVKESEPHNNVFDADMSPCN